jgi:hypothetical protein
METGMDGGDGHVPSFEMLETIAARVRAEYRDMPGLSLTAPQAARLLSVQLPLCVAVLQELVGSGDLYNTSRGAYIAAPPTRGHSLRP